MKNPILVALAVFSAVMLTACNSEVRYLAYSSLSHNVMLGDISPRYVASVPVAIRVNVAEQIEEIQSRLTNQQNIMAAAAPPDPALGATPPALPNFTQNIGAMPYRFDYGFDGSCIMLCGGDEVLLSGSGVLLVNLDRRIVQLSDIHLTSADNNFNFTIDALTGRLDHSITADVQHGAFSRADLMQTVVFDNTGNLEFTGYDPNTDVVNDRDIIFEVQSTAPSGATLGFIFASGTPIIN